MVEIGPGWEHYDYEVQMFEITAGKLLNGYCLDVYSWNTTYESCAVHANNLLGTISEEDIPDEIKDIRKKLHDQVFSLTVEGRTSEMKEKVGSDQIRILYDFIVAQRKER